MARAAAAAAAAVAIAVGLLAVWLHHWPVATNDFGLEAAAAYRALLHGHPLRFLALAPAYGGSLELRAPFALLAGALGGGDEAVYRVAAVPCLLAAASLGGWLLAHTRAGVARVPAAVALLAICVVNPLTYRALAIGHPEELLGGALCVGAVLCAMRGRAAWAGLLLGLAIANKQWALLAVGPVLLALPARRGLALLLAAATATAFLLPLALATGGGVAGVSGRLAVTDAGTQFHPQQLWWLFGHPVAWVPSMAGQIPMGYRLSPTWLQGRAHMIVILSAAPLTYLALRRSRRDTDPLLLLALLMLLRCALDPWDVAYYPLPFLLALVSWEALARGGFPWLALAATAAGWLLFDTLPRHAGLDVQAIAFAALALPAIALIAGRLYGRAPARTIRQRHQHAAGVRMPGAA